MSGTPALASCRSSCRSNGIARIVVRYENLAGERHEICAGDDRNLSELLQHDIDHLGGTLAVDRITDLKTLCTREEFEKRYRDASPYAIAPA
ncbi:MAG: peptide deformylase [Terriglobales bacterium]